MGCLFKFKGSTDSFPFLSEAAEGDVLLMVVARLKLSR